MFALTVLGWVLCGFLSFWGARQLVLHGGRASARFFPLRIKVTFVAGREQAAQLVGEWDVKAIAERLEAAGFVPEGVLVEAARGLPPTTCVAWRHEAEHICASIWMFGDAPKLTLLSVANAHAAVLTGNYPRQTERSPGLIIAGTPGTVEDALTTHRRHLEELARETSATFPPLVDEAAHCQAVQSYYEHPGVQASFRGSLSWRSREAGLGLLALLAAAALAVMLAR